METGILLLVFGLVLYPLLFMGPALLTRCDKDIEDISPAHSRSQSRKDGWYFPSRRSLALTVAIWASLLPLLAFTGFSRQYPAFIILMLVSLLMLWLQSTTGYTLTDSQLVIRSAFFRWQVDLASLKKVCRTNNPLSAPALSLKRLGLTTTDGGLLLISPVDEELFLKMLKERSPNLAGEITKA